MEQSEVVWAIVVLAFILGVLGVIANAGASNENLQKSYNESVVKCVAAGGDPLECKVSLQPRSFE